MEELAELRGRITALEDRVRQLERTWAPRGEQADADRFWALHGLEERLPEATGAVVFAGRVPLPSGGTYRWQWSVGTAELVESDWAAVSGVLDALAHPVRLRLLRRALLGAEQATELQDLEHLGTTGQLYHHLRQLVSAGWLRATARGRYAVPAERIVPLLVVLAAARR